MKLFLSAFLLTCSVFISAQDFVPNLGPDLPAITLRSGEISLLLRQKTQWTPGRFDYRGHPMTTERSAYGTVFMFPEIGFIGTGHLENEPETLLEFSISVDGVQQEAPQELIEGNRIQVTRVSKIRAFTLTNVIELSNDRITERATVVSEAEVSLKLLYHFMHAWTPSVSAYCAELESGEMESAPLLDGVEKAFHIQKPCKWIAVYEPKSSQFAVSRLTQQPESIKTTSKLWNVPGTYRKFYLQSFYNEAVPKGFQGTWEMVTTFGSSAINDWETKATELAATLSAD